MAELQQLFDSVEAKQYKRPDMNEDLRLGFASDDFAGTKWKPVYEDPRTGFGAHELKDLLPAGDEAGAEHAVDAEGLARRGGRRGGVAHCVWELLLQLQIVQNEAVAIVGYAEAVRGSEVGADPGGQPGARARTFRKESPVQSPRRSADAGTLPGLPRSCCPSRLPSWLRASSACRFSHWRQALAAADACAEDDLVGIGGCTSLQVVWFAETWNMQDIRAVWPCLVKPGQRYIACF